MRADEPDGIRATAGDLIQRIAEAASRYRAPLTLVVLGVLAYGLFIPSLGFYWDDWPAIAVGEIAGPAGFPPYFASDRPIAGVSAAALYWLLGSNPLLWHLWALALRVGMGIGAWALIRTIWPHRRFEAFGLGVLVVLYPGFTGQPLAVVFSMALLTVAAFITSLALSVRALSARGRRRIILHAAALVLFAVSIPSEILVPVELVRPALFIVALGGLHQAWKTRLRTTLANWAPYLALIFLFVSWRLFIFTPTRGSVATIALQRLACCPLEEIPFLYGLARHDLVMSMWRAWLRPFGVADPVPDFIEVSSQFAGFPWTPRTVFLVMLAAVSIWWAGRHQAGMKDRRAADAPNGTTEGAQPPGPTERGRWGIGAIIWGLAVTVLARIPWWLAHIPGQLNPLQDRVYLTMGLGAALVLVGLITWLIRERVTAIALVVVIAAPAIAFHDGVSRMHADDWEVQRAFASQMGLAAPELADGTAIALDTDALLIRRGYMLASLAAIMYGGSSWDGEVITPRVWVLDSSSRHFARTFIFDDDRGRLDQTIRTISYEGTFEDMLFVRYRPPGCLRLFGRHWNEIPYLSESEAMLGPHSNPDLIALASAPRTPPGFMGEGEVSPWCRLFLVAQVMAERQDWDGVGSLAVAALDRRLMAGEPSEWLLYTEALLRTGRASEAADALSRATATDPVAICAFATRLSSDASIPPGPAVEALHDIASSTECRTIATAAPPG